MNPTRELASRPPAATLLIALVMALTAQGRQGSRSEPRGIDRVIRERQRALNTKAVEDELRRPAGRQESQLAVAQIKEDYVRIQVVSSDLARAATLDGELDLKFVAKSASEIKKRAERLKSNLELPEPEKDSERTRAPTADGEGQMKASLLSLCKLVTEFVRNPIFREVNVLDARSSARARRDLDSIVELSGRLKKDSEKSGRPSQK